MKLNTWMIALVVPGLIGLGCGDDDDTSSNPDAGGKAGSSSNAGTGGKAGSGADKDSGTDEADAGSGPARPRDLDEMKWKKISPGGDTICARGDAFHYFVRGGKVNKLAILFDGGGACWDATTCAVGDALFDDLPDEELMEPGDGIADKTNAENPFRDWYQIFIPYCTADVHWGDNVMEYEPANADDEPIVINHKGQTNTHAVLEWVYENFEAPESIFVTGASAGSYGSVMWAPYIMEHYPNSFVSQLGDCGAGVITDTFFEDSFPSWKADSAIPDWVPELDIPITELKLEDVYIALSNHYPDNVYSQYNTNNDENQRFYYTAMGGLDEDWSPKMHEKIDAIIEGAPKFRSFIMGGEKHVVLPYPEFYTYEADGTRVRDWVADLANGEPVENVQCVDCEEAEIFEP